MSAADLYEDGYPHGTSEGYDGGCRGGACPGELEHGLTCKRAKTLSNGDHRYKKLRAAGHTPREIVAIIDGTGTPDEKVMPLPAHLQPAPLPNPLIIPDRGRGRGPSKSNRTRDENTAIRDWAAANGIECAPRGAIPARVATAYDEALAASAGPELVQTKARVASPADVAKVTKAPQATVVDEGAPFSPETMDHFQPEPVDPEPTDVVLEVTPDAAAVTDALRLVKIEEPKVKIEGWHLESQAETTPAIAPREGMRARTLYDTGVAVVREVNIGITRTTVRVTYLPDVLVDERARESVAWLNTMSDPLPADQFRYDEFPTWSQIPHELEQWQEHQDEWQRQLETLQSTVAEDPEAALTESLNAIAAEHPDSVETVAALATAAGVLDERLTAAAEAFAADLFGNREPSRPEWSDVAIAEDVESARNLAVRLEQELAKAEEERDTALAALEFTLRKWEADREALGIQQRIIHNQDGARIALDKVITHQKGTIRLLEALYEHADEEARHGRTVIEQHIATPWWRRILPTTTSSTPKETR